MGCVFFLILVEEKTGEKIFGNGIKYMLIELAIGDAYGAGFEFVDQQTIQLYNNLKGYIKHPHHDIGPGCYTDDTQMSLAVAEAIVSRKLWTPELLATKFVAAFHRDRRLGIENATIQAAITHNIPDGIKAAIAAALMSHYFIYQLGLKKNLGNFLEQHVPGEWSIPWQGEVSTKGVVCVRAAITAVMLHDSMSKLLQACIAFSGDVDTVATIALAAGSCSIEIAQDLPENLVQGLENQSYGRDYIRGLDRQLMNCRSDF